MSQPPHSCFLQSLALARVHGGVQNVPVSIRRLQRGVGCCLLFLLVLGLWQELYLAPTGNKTLALKVVPWLLALPGVYRHKLYTFRVLSLLLWLYVLGPILDLGAFFFGIDAAGVQAMLPWAAAVQISLCLLLFLLCGRYVRARLANGYTNSQGQ